MNKRELESELEKVKTDLLYMTKYRNEALIQRDEELWDKSKYRTALIRLAGRSGISFDGSLYGVDNLADDLETVAQAQDAKDAEERLTPKKTTTKK